MSAVPGAGQTAALILAAGKGTRLGGLGQRRAKALVDVGGRPLLDHHLEHLAQQGIKRVVVNAHHLSEQIVEHVAAYRGPLEVTVLVEPTLLGTAGAAINALDAVGRMTFLVIYGDVLIFEPLAPLLETHARTGAVATLAVYAHDDTTEKGVVEVDEAGRVTGFAEKDPERTGPGLVNAGLYAVEPALLHRWPRGQFLDFGHDLFPAAVRAGELIQAYRIPQPVLDVGTPADLARAGGQGPSPSG
jgi:NDP-sugar pyrophosphorylase family protein